MWVHTVCRSDFLSNQQKTKQTTIVVIGALRVNISVVSRVICFLILNIATSSCGKPIVLFYFTFVNFYMFKDVHYAAMTFSRPGPFLCLHKLLSITADIQTTYTSIASSPNPKILVRFIYQQRSHTKTCPNVANIRSILFNLVPMNTWSIRMF